MLELPVKKMRPDHLLLLEFDSHGRSLEMPHSCPIPSCPFVPKNWQSLSVHLSFKHREHEAAKIYGCGICTNRFRVLADRNHHREIHRQSNLQPKRTKNGKPYRASDVAIGKRKIGPGDNVTTVKRILSQDNNLLKCLHVIRCDFIAKTAAGLRLHSRGAHVVCRCQVEGCFKQYGSVKHLKEHDKIEHSNGKAGTKTTVDKSKSNMAQPPSEQDRPEPPTIPEASTRSIGAVRGPMTYHELQRTEMARLFWRDNNGTYCSKSMGRS